MGTHHILEREIPLDLIVIDPECEINFSIDDIRVAAIQLENNGQSYPLYIRPIIGDLYLTITGEIWVLAAKALKKKTVLAIVEIATGATAAYLRYEHNSTYHKSTFGLIAQSESLANIHKHSGDSVEKIAKWCRKRTSTVGTMIAIGYLPSELLEEITSSRWTLDAIYELLRFSNISRDTPEIFDEMRLAIQLFNKNKLKHLADLHSYVDARLTKFEVDDIVTKPRFFPKRKPTNEATEERIAREYSIQVEAIRQHYATLEEDLKAKAEVRVDRMINTFRQLSGQASNLAGVLTSEQLDLLSERNQQELYLEITLLIEKLEIALNHLRVSSRNSVQHEQLS